MARSPTNRPEHRRHGPNHNTHIHFCIKYQFVNQLDKTRQLYFERNQIYFERNQIYFEWNQSYFERNQIYFERNQSYFERNQSYFERNQSYFERNQCYFERNQIYFERNQTASISLKLYMTLIKHAISLHLHAWHTSDHNTQHTPPLNIKPRPTHRLNGTTTRYTAKAPTTRANDTLNGQTNHETATTRANDTLNGQTNKGVGMSMCVW